MKKILTVMIIGLAAPAFAAETLNGAVSCLLGVGVFV